MSRGAVLGCLLVGSLWPSRAGHAQSVERRVLSLAEAEAMALASSPMLEVADRELELSRAKRDQASHARFLPKFELRNIWGPIPRQRGEFTSTGVLVSPDTSTGFSDLRFFTQVDLDITQPIWTSGKIGGLIEAADRGVEAAEANVRKERSDIRLQVRKAYWGLVLGYEMEDVIRDAREQAEEARVKLEERFDEGSDQVTQNDMFKFEIFTYDLNKRARDVADRIELARAALKAVVGLDGSEEVDVDTRVLEPVDAELADLTTYTAMALESRAELGQLEAGIGALSALVRVHRSDYAPHLFAGVQVKYNRAPSRFDPRNPFWNNRTNFFRPGLAVGFNWNLNFSQTRDRVNVARRDEARLASQRRPLRNGITLKVREAYLETIRAKANLADSRKARRASENWLRAELQTFDLGIGDIKDVIDAFKANSTMRVEHLRNIFEYNTALAELSQAVGRDLYGD
ncbi:MAG: TolC family protein [Gemmatimonadota bacterium]